MHLKKWELIGTKSKQYPVAQLSWLECLTVYQEAEGSSPFVTAKFNSMKLYEVPRNTWIKVMGDVKVPPAAPEIEPDNKLFFRRIDGMYSVCTLDDKNPINYDEVVHLVAWAEVEIIK